MIMFIFLTTVDLKTDSFNSSVLGQNRFRLSCRVGILGIKRTESSAVRPPVLHVFLFS